MSHRNRASTKKLTLKQLFTMMIHDRENLIVYKSWLLLLGGYEYIIILNGITASNRCYVEFYIRIEE